MFSIFTKKKKLLINDSDLMVYFQWWKLKVPWLIKKVPWIFPKGKGYYGYFKEYCRWLIYLVQSYYFILPSAYSYRLPGRKWWCFRQLSHIAYFSSSMRGDFSIALKYLFINFIFSHLSFSNIFLILKYVWSSSSIKKIIKKIINFFFSYLISL